VGKGEGEETKKKIMDEIEEKERKKGGRWPVLFVSFFSGNEGRGGFLAVGEEKKKGVHCEISFRNHANVSKPTSGRGEKRVEKKEREFSLSLNITRRRGERRGGKKEKERQLEDAYSASASGRKERGGRGREKEKKSPFPQFSKGGKSLLNSFNSFR